jgi:hypothetical protein
MDDLQGPEKVSDTCGKMMNLGTMDRDFTVLSSDVTSWKYLIFHIMISNFEKCSRIFRFSLFKSKPSTYKKFLKRLHAKDPQSEQ